jgi:hypothetical protein
VQEEASFSLGSRYTNHQDQELMDSDNKPWYIPELFLFKDRGTAMVAEQEARRALIMKQATTRSYLNRQVLRAALTPQIQCGIASK